MSSFFDTARKKAVASTAAAAASVASSPPLVANVSSAFGRFSTQSPEPSHGECVCVWREPLAESAQGSTIGEHIVCLPTSDVCGEMIGSGGKFCCKRKPECLVAKHDREKCSSLVPGFYIKAGPFEAYCTPVVNLSRFGVEARQHFLDLDFKTVSDIRPFFVRVNASDTTFASRKDVEVASQKVESSDFLTPGPKHLKRNDL